MKRPKNKRETENGYGPNKMLPQERKTESTEHISCLKDLQPGNFRMIGTVIRVVAFCPGAMAHSQVPTPTYVHLFS